MLPRDPYAPVQLSPEASRVVLEELARPAADTPERRATFARVDELAASEGRTATRRALATAVLLVLVGFALGIVFTLYVGGA